ncbi:hypothetical protein V3851_00920 [Paenibacillus sp. M1]|uniref:Uncharacterized protein n=1 Tax=Paenibacillus haidiansis TaxID=1574488 RepID=A0ABU7VKT0_9BACL
MTENDDAQAFTALFLKFSERAERWLKKAAIVLFVLLCLFQAALRVPAVRHLLASADKLEGSPVHRTDGR